MNEHTQIKSKGETPLQARQRRLAKLKQITMEHSNIRMDSPEMEKLLVGYLQSEGLSRRTILDYLDAIFNIAENGELQDGIC
jgi:hypothetical protein